MEFFLVTFAEFCSFSHVNAFRLSRMHVSTQVCLSTHAGLLCACLQAYQLRLTIYHIFTVHKWLNAPFFISVHSEPRLENTDRCVHVYFTKCRCLILISVWFITRDTGLSFRPVPMFLNCKVPKPRRQSKVTLRYYPTELLFNFAILKRSVS